MKATELMIGDWVIFEDEPLKVQHVYNNGFDDVVAEITEDSLNEYGVCEEIRDVRSINCSPIPLTNEILEKNGWHFDLTPYEKDLNECCGMSIDKHWCYADTNINISLFLPITGLEMGRLEVHNHHLKRYLEFWICDTLYVHEMQHALRLCGLNELADNFKV